MNGLHRTNRSALGSGTIPKSFQLRVKTSRREGNSDEPKVSIRVLFKYQADSAIATSDDSYFPFKCAHFSTFDDRL